LHLMQASVTT